MVSRSTVFGAVIGVVIVFFLMLPAPYVIERPGQTVDTLGEILIDGETSPVIEIADAETFSAAGELRLVTVSLRGNPDHKNRWFEVLPAFIDPKQSVIPMDQVFPNSVTAEMRDENNKRLMDDSQVVATAAALTELEIDYDSAVLIAGVEDASPAKGVLKPGDRVLKVLGNEVSKSHEVIAYISDAALGSEIEIVVSRDGREIPVAVRTADLRGNGKSAIGVLITTDYEFPINPEIVLEKIGGPSAGLIFSLGIVESLTETNFVDDLVVTATGTVNPDGAVGAIGGLTQKIWAASRAKSDIFLMPAENCKDLPTKLPKKMSIMPVENLKQAVQAIESFDGMQTASVSELCGDLTLSTNG